MIVPKAKVVVLIPDGTLLHGVVDEVGRGGSDKDPLMFSVRVFGGDVTLTFLGPPDEHGWWQGGHQYFRRGYFCIPCPILR